MIKSSRIQWHLPAVVRLSSYSTKSPIVLLWNVFKKRWVVCGNDWSEWLMYRSRISKALIIKLEACSKSSSGTPEVSSPEIETRWKCGTISSSSSSRSSVVWDASPTPNVDCRSSSALLKKKQKKIKINEIKEWNSLIEKKLIFETNLNAFDW